MKRRTWLQWGCAGMLQAAAMPLWAEDPTTPIMTLSGMDAGGHKVELSDYLGKVVLVSFFTSGCALCAREIKVMREFYVNNMSRNFVVLGVIMDSDKNDVDTYNQVVAVTVPKAQRFPMVWRNAPAHKDNFGSISRQPTHFVINRQNEFVFRREGSFEADDWTNLAQSLG